MLDPIEPPDLLAIYNKVFGEADQPALPEGSSEIEAPTGDEQQPVGE
jgi:hypothetical protein